MTSASTGWSNGGLRTTDGGAHWRDVSPTELRADAPSDAAPRSYPPGYIDFFLDSNHAWLVRSYPSLTSCFDHLSVFMTSDGGRTWTSSRVNAAVQADNRLELQLDFIDAQHGWLMVLAGGRIAPDRLLYSTANGGLNWQLVSQLPMASQGCGVKFTSYTTGYLGGCLNTSAATATLTGTHDRGKTWDTIRLPEPFGTSFTVLPPVFLDKDQGFVSVIARETAGSVSTAHGYLVATTDGGITWRVLPSLPTSYARTFGFLDPNHFWELGDKGTSQALYGTSDGGQTWTLLPGDLPALFQNNPKVLFINSETVYLIEPSQQIGQGPKALLVTHDGGHTWKQIRPQIS